MRYHILYAVPFAASLLAGCQHMPDAGPTPQVSVVPVSDIVNALKCELAETFHGRDYVGTFVDDSIAASLTLSVGVGRSTTGNAAANVTLGAIGLGATGSAGQSRSDSNSLKIDFNYAVSNDHEVPAYCADLAAEVSVDGDPFVQLLDNMRQEYAEIEIGDPPVDLTALSYSVGFKIEEKIGGGVRLNFLVFQVGGSTSLSEASSQSLTLQFKLVTDPRLL